MSPRITYLSQGDEPPTGEPRRYLDNRGYTRLRWKVGKGVYVESWLRDESGALVRTVPKSDRWIDHDELRRLYVDERKSTTEIASILGCNCASVSRSLQRQGVRARRTEDYALPVDVDDLLRRYEALEGYSAIAKALGISVVRVRRILVEQGVTLRGPGNHTTRSGGTVSYETEFNRAMVLVKARSQGRCEARFSPACTHRATHGHHRKLRRHGAKNDLATLLHVCHSCHAHIHGNPTKSYSLGLLVHSWADPTEVPVWEAAA